MPSHERHLYDGRFNISLPTQLILISFLYFLTFAYCSSALSININDESSDGINNEEVSDIAANIIDEDRHILAAIITDDLAIESEDGDDDVAKSEQEEEHVSGGRIKISSHHFQPLAQYYFSNEIDFLAKQAMVLGDFHPTSKEEEINTNTNQDDDDIERLRFIEKSLRLELDYIRRLKEMLKNPDETLDNRTTAESSSSSISENSNKRGTSEIILHSINDATWPTWASYATNFTHYSTIETDDDGYDDDGDDDAFDYDDVAERGFGNMHEDFNCREHSKNQNKPIYTHENWEVVWDAFIESTLFPFPRPEESVRIYYTDLAPGKGRGNFAWFDIPKGILLHEGHPNTVFFLNNSSFYRFISLLPREYQCDVLEWVWQQDLTHSGNTVLCLNMDEGVFTNGGGDEWGGTINIEMKESTSLNFYAARDIEKGEELLYDYESMEFDTYDMDL